MTFRSEVEEKLELEMKRKMVHSNIQCELPNATTALCSTVQREVFRALMFFPDICLNANYFKSLDLPRY